MIDLSDKKFVFFDMDGLLLDTETLYYETRKQILADYGFSFSKDEHSKYVGRGFPDSIRRLQKLVGDKELGQIVFDKAMKLYQQRLTSGQIQLMPGAIDLLRFLQDHDKQSFITSSSGKETIIQTANVTGLKPYFTGFISGDEVTKNKPAPDIYLHALSKAQAKKEQAVVFEDAPTGIIAGAKAGIDVVAVPDLISLDKSTQALARITVPNLSAVLPFFTATTDEKQ